MEKSGRGGQQSLNEWSPRSDSEEAGGSGT